MNFPAKTRTCAEPFYVVVTGDDSSHSQGQSGKRLLLAYRGHPARTPAYQGSCIYPTHLTHTLDPTPDLPFPITDVTIRLLIKDFECLKEHFEVQMSHAGPLELHVGLASSKNARYFTLQYIL